MFEIKLDGYRALAIKANRKLSLSSRRRKFFNRQHRCVFNFLQHSKSQARRICYFVFDLLVYQNRDLTQLPMIERRDTHTQLCTQIPLSEGCVRPPEVRSLERNSGTRANMSGTSSGNIVQSGRNAGPRWPPLAVPPKIQVLIYGPFMTTPRPQPDLFASAFDPAPHFR